MSERRCAEVLSDEHKDGSLWINRKGEIWSWVHGDWRMLRKSGLWSGMGLYSGETQMLHRARTPKSTSPGSRREKRSEREVFVRPDRHSPGA